MQYTLDSTLSCWMPKVPLLWHVHKGLKGTQDLLISSRINQKVKDMMVCNTYFCIFEYITTELFTRLLNADFSEMSILFKPSLSFFLYFGILTPKLAQRCYNTFYLAISFWIWKSLTSVKDFHWNFMASQVIFNIVGWWMKCLFIIWRIYMSKVIFAFLSNYQL